MSDRPSLFRLLDSPHRAMGAGVLLALAMPPLGLFPLAWVALVPILVRWERLRHGWTLFREAYVLFLFMAVGSGFGVLFHRSMTAALFSGAGLLLLPFPYAAAFALSSPIRKRFGLLVGLLALTANVLAVEYLAAHVPGGLPWLLIGHTQASAAPFHQIADLGGVGLLTLFVLVANFFGYAFVRTAPKPGLLPGGRTLLALLFLVFLSGVSVYADERAVGLGMPRGELAVTVVQPAEPAAAWSNSTDWKRVERLAAMSDRALARPASGDVRPIYDRAAHLPRLLVWPEIALPLLPDVGAQERLYRRLGLWSARRDIDLLTGALTRSTPGAPLHNAALFIRDDEPPQEYRKVYLTPLVERVPFLSHSPLLGVMTLPEPGTPPPLANGSTPGFFAGDGYHAGVVIGFESMRGDYVRRLVKGGAEVVVTLAEDGWWGRSPMGQQHLALTRLRAIETRRAVVMATVSGTSAVVYPDGTVDELAGWMEPEVAERAVPLQGTPTLYTRHGDWVGRFGLWGSGWFLVVWGAAVVFFRKQAPPPMKRKQEDD